MKQIERMLYDYPYIDERIREVERQLKDIIELIADVSDRLKAITLSDMPKALGGHSDQCMDALLESEKLMETFKNRINKLDKDADELLEQKSQVEGMLKCLPMSTRKIIELRYFKNLDWDTVAAQYASIQNSKCYDVRHIKRVSKEAIEIMSQNVTKCHTNPCYN